MTSHTCKEFLSYAHSEQSPVAELLLAGFRIPATLLPSRTTICHFFPVIAFLSRPHKLLIRLGADGGDARTHLLHLVEREEVSYYEIAMLVQQRLGTVDICKCGILDFAR